MTEIVLKPDDIKQRKINIDIFFSGLVEDELSISLKNNLIKYLDHIESQIDGNQESQQ